MVEYMADFARGLADGTGFSYEDVVWTQQYQPVYFYVHTPAQLEPALPGVTTGCTTVVFARDEHDPIVSRNMDGQQDWGEKFPHVGEPTLNVQPAERGYIYVSGPGSLNEKGLSLVGSSISWLRRCGASSPNITRPTSSAPTSTGCRPATSAPSTST